MLLKRQLQERKPTDALRVAREREVVFAEDAAEYDYRLHHRKLVANTLALPAAEGHKPKVAVDLVGIERAAPRHQILPLRVPL
jgi:hypothetical protein